MPWAPTKMPIEWDPSDQEVPCGLLSLSLRAVPRRIRGRRSYRLVAARGRSGGRDSKEGYEGYEGLEGREDPSQAGREGVPRGVRAYLLLFEIWRAA